MKRIKKYQITFNPEDEIEGIELISFVHDPAVIVKGMCFSEQKEKKFEFKFNDDKMIVVAPAMIPDLEIYRKDESGEYYVVFTKEVIFDLMKKFNSQMKEFRFNIDHSTELAPAYILESWIIEDQTYDKSNYYGFEKLPIGTWMISAQITDKGFWENEIKSNGKTGFSIEGFLSLIEAKLSEQVIEKELTPLQKYRIKKREKYVDVNPGESEQEYIGRCMGSDTMKSEFPDETQRYAVCKAKWDKS